MYPYNFLITYNNEFNFWKDIFPILISSIALMEVFLLEWLNITSENEKMTDEFIEALKAPKTLFLKDFQLYEFPSLDFFNTFNNELLNECYVQVRKLKQINYYLKTINSEYLAYRRMLVEKESNNITNAGDFYREALYSIKKEYLTIFNDLNELKIIIGILLKKANNVDSLTVYKFFNLNPKKIICHKTDIKFTDEEIQIEKNTLEKDKEKYKNKKSPLN